MTDDSLEAYDYFLPPELIAQRPLPDRESSRLMVLTREGRRVSHHSFSELPELLRPGDLVVLNDTKVIPARLKGRREDTGGEVELLLVSRLEPDVWRVLARPARRLRTGTRIVIGSRPAIEVIGCQPEGRRTIRFLQPERDVIGAHGMVPLPPYIKERLEDPCRYQTVYARVEGSVAAPTAGLHFTPRLLARLRERGIELCSLTLHIGPGTFAPIRTENIREHRLHSEYVSISATTAAAIARARAAGRRIVAVGTTVVRALESHARLAAPGTAYEGWTDLYIVPGFEFQVVSALITNFHLPRSTLLVLVAAFAGREFILDAYRQAVEAGYRFYSFGDAMLIL